MLIDFFEAEGMACPPFNRIQMQNWRSRASGPQDEGDKWMPGKRFPVEQIFNHLREADVRLARGETASKICRGIGITEQSYYRWRRECGGLKVEQVFASSRIWGVRMHG